MSPLRRTYSTPNRFHLPLSQATRCITAVGIALCYGFWLSGAFAGEINIIDGFDDGDAKNGPVVWNLVFSGNAKMDASTGDLIATAAQAANAGLWFEPASQEYRLEDTSIRAQLRLEGEGRRVWLWAQARLGDADGWKWVVGMLYPDGTLELQHEQSNMMLVAQTDLRVLEEDVVLQLDVIGNQASLFAWRPDDRKPEEPQISMELQSVQPGILGPGMNRPGENTSFIVRYVQFACEPIEDIGPVPPPPPTFITHADSVSFELTDTETTILNPDTIVLTIDKQIVTPETNKVGGLTTIKYVYQSIEDFPFGSEHTYALQARDALGAVFDWNGNIDVPSPFLPLEQSLLGPNGVEGAFGVRYLWGVPGINSLEQAVEAIQSVSEPTFKGQVFDTTHPFINHGDAPERGLFGEERTPYSQEFSGQQESLLNDFFVQLAKGHIQIREEGPYTFGVHSDDGFALRIMGAEFSSVSGRGHIDPASPDTIVHPSPSSNTSTRAVVNLEKGTYAIEFLWWEATGEDFGELVVAKGAFVDNADTDTWQLVGLGLPLVASSAPIPEIIDIRVRDDKVELDFRTSDPSATHVLEQNATLRPNQWRVVDDVTRREGLSQFVIARSEAPKMHFRIVLGESPRLFADDFDEGADGWTPHTEAGQTQWELGEPTGPALIEGHIPRTVYGTDLDAPYGNGVVATLRSPLIDLTQVGHTTLSFWYYVDTPKGSDGVALSGFNQAGDLLFSRINEDEIFSGRSEGWTEFRMAMPVATRDQRIILEWKLLTDDSEPNGTGFFLDDVAVD